ncbi:GNAT family N-acetyltransferase [Amaricoccus tamworthensis]|uniref:GNAT family N-acetyltransferase n=1 Tax=Amaricoccus tamworthensis TaxID=57002 RepID=UPI003C79C079
MGLVLRRRRTLPILETERMVLRLPEMRDYSNWSTLRREGEDFLRPWEPAWSPDHFSKRSFRARVYWASRARDDGRALSMFLISRHNEELLGAITLDNIRRGPAQTGSVGYWIGPNHARQGYMSEALLAVTDHAFSVLDLSRIEAACLPENTPSRGLLQRSGFVEEGRAESYLQINGQWRDHVLYSKLRLDRRQYRHMESEF